VPAAAVIRGLQALSGFIGRKAREGGPPRKGWPRPNFAFEFYGGAWANSPALFGSSCCI